MVHEVTMPLTANSQFIQAGETSLYVFKLNANIDSILQMIIMTLARRTSLVSPIPGWLLSQHHHSTRVRYVHHLYQNPFCFNKQWPTTTSGKFKKNLEDLAGL